MILLNDMWLHYMWSCYFILISSTQGYRLVYPYQQPQPPQPLIPLIGCTQYHCPPNNQGDPKYTLASVSLNIGHLKAHFSLGSDTYQLQGQQNIQQLQSLMNLPPETKKQLQLATRTILETFGLYEPFKERHRSVIVNNPIYHGHQSGMVNYVKKVHGNTESNRKSSLEKMSDEKMVDGDRKLLKDLEWLHSGEIDDDKEEKDSFVIRKMNRNIKK